MKSKALDNIASAQSLIRNKQFTTSVHCSYYAVFQYMKYVLANTNRKPMTYEKQAFFIGESSHDHIFNEIKNRLQTSPKNERSFSEGLRFLKSERVDADYSIRNFTDEQSKDCIELASNLISNLKTYFGNL